MVLLRLRGSVKIVTPRVSIITVIKTVPVMPTNNLNIQRWISFGTTRVNLFLTVTALILLETNNTIMVLLVSSSFPSSIS